MPVYVVVGGFLLILVMLLAGNLAFYKMYGLDGIERSLDDAMRFRFHIGFSSDYLKYYGAAASLYVIGALLIYGDNQKYRHDAAGIEGGSAKWTTNYKYYNRTHADPIGQKAWNGPMNMIHSEHVRLSIEDKKTRLNNNVIIVGGAGTGKSRFVMKPNLLQENASFVLTDPSAELLGTLGKEMKSQGYEVKVFNLVNMGFSNCYNPFCYIRDDAGVGILVDTLITNTTPPEKSGGEPFWENSEKALLSANIFYLRDFADKKDQNFPMVLKMIQMAQMDESPGAKGPSSVDDTNLGKLFTGKAYIENGEFKEYTNKKESELRAQEIKKSQAWKNYQTFSLGGVKTLKSILISAAVRLNPFNISEIANLTGSDNIDLGSIGDKKTIIFVIIPQAYSTYNFIVSMMYSQLFDTLYYKAEHTKPTEDDPDASFLRLKYHVRFMMDEFANIGKIPEFPAKISTMRKYNISCTIVLQSLAQLKTMYKDDYETIIGNCDTNILLGTQEQTTAEYYSKQLGFATIRKRGESISTGKKSGGGMNFGPQKRELMTMDEIRTMPPDRCLVFVKNVDPFYDKKFPLETHPRYKYTGDADNKYMFDITKEKDENGKVIFMNSTSKVYEDMSVAPPQETEDTLSYISKPKNIGDIGLGNKEEPDDPKVKLAHIRDLDTKQEGRQYKIAQFGEINKALNKEVAIQRKSGKKEPVICIHIPQMDFNDIPMFTRMAYKKYNAPVLIFTNDLTVFLYTTLIGYYIDKNGILESAITAYANGEKGYLYSEDEDTGTSMYCIKGISLEAFDTMRQSLRLKDNGLGAAQELNEYLNECGMF